MILGENIDRVCSEGREIKQVYSYGKLVWEKSYSRMPFTVKSLNDKTKVWLSPKKHKSVDEHPVLDFKYSINGGSWIQTTTETVITINTNDVLSIIAYDIESCTIKGDIWYNHEPDKPAWDYTEEHGVSDIFGNIMSLIYGDDFIGKTTWQERGQRYDRDGFFAGSNIRSAEKLVLPATTLTEDAYEWMFLDCRDLIAAPEELPATTLAKKCYSGMFFNCSNLTTSPELPANVLAEACYYEMYALSGLTTAPELPANVLAEACYANMYAGCSNLTTPSELPATTLANHCYESMYAYSGLTTAPELPATTLAQSCYLGMFEYCGNLTAAPELPAKTLVAYCYNGMFKYCSSLNYLKCHATEVEEGLTLRDCIYRWTLDVSDTGSFLCRRKMGEDFIEYIPDSWTIGYLD